MVNTYILAPDTMEPWPRGGHNGIEFKPITLANRPVLLETAAAALIPTPLNDPVLRDRGGYLRCTRAATGVWFRR